jgi:hypothetical protein
VSLLKKIGIGLGIFVVACVAVDVGGRMMFPEKWKELDAKVEADRAASKAKAEEAAAQKEKDKKPSGATIAGGIVAIEMARDGAIKPDAAQVEALARRAATEHEVPQGNRSRYVSDFEFGFWQGWKTATR